MTRLAALSASIVRNEGFYPLGPLISPVKRVPTCSICVSSEQLPRDVAAQGVP